MLVSCDHCSARGWNSPAQKDSFPEPCAFCRGQGSVSLSAICDRIQEDPETVKRLIHWRYLGKGRPRMKVATRIFEKLVAL